ncbi:MAG: M23 family metallopeptidase [Candidatus Zixiibacteriota bacterium]
MNILSTISKALLIILISAVPFAVGADRTWPVKGDIDLSSTFCDYRQLHFHGGMDIRTGGVEGRQVFSPVDGYVWRIKYSYIGYGKAIYLMDSQGFIYVFGHLSGLSDRLDKIVKEIQYTKESYSFDTTFSKSQLPVKQGELIALSGQTGFGGPHLHFEIRNPQNMPLNPLTNGFPLPDNSAPVFEGLMLAYQDTVSLFPDGLRKILVEPRKEKSKGKYQIASPVLVQGPFGVAVKVGERMRSNGPKLNIRKARLFIDDYLYYESDYGQYDYEQTTMVDLCFDYYLKMARDQNWHLLYEPDGKVFAGSHSAFEKGGVFAGRTTFSYGLHNGRVEVYDAAGNMSELDFKFVWAPEKLYEVGKINDSTLYLRAEHDTRNIDVSGIAVYAVGSGDNIQRIDPGLIESMGSGDYKINIPTESKRVDGFRIDILGESGWRSPEVYIPSQYVSDSKYEFDYELMDGGILLNVRARDKFAPPPEIELAYEDGFVNKIETKAVSSLNFAAFYKNTGIKTRITEINISTGGNSRPLASLTTNIVLTGEPNRQAALSVPGVLEVSIPGQALYSSALIGLQQAEGRYDQTSSIIGDVYKIDPVTLPLAKNISLSATLNDNNNPAKVSFYRLNSKRKWSRLNSKVVGDKVNTESSLTGTFAVIRDGDAPHVRKISPSNGRTIQSNMPLIKCNVSEDLSGIDDNNKITITLDGEWLIPEYDPETEILKTTPRKPLKNGKHELVIKVSDYAGNERVVHSHFTVEKD